MVSYFFIHECFPENISESIRAKAQQLKEFYVQIGVMLRPTLNIPSSQPGGSAPMSFLDISYSDTRNSTNAKEIDWVSVEKELVTRGYALKKRDYLGNAFNDLSPVYILEHPEMGVISEGKGLTHEQAKKSALAEGIERITAKSPSLDAQTSFITETYKNLYTNKSWDPSKLTGPRDAFSENILTEWTPSLNITKEQGCFMPTEISYYEYVPSNSQTRLFSMHHTMGLAAGSSTEDATLSGIFEILERDAYWITMRCKITHPDIELNKVPDLDPKIFTIIQELERKGFKLSIKDMSLDWGVPIVHAVLTDTSGGIPSFAHGTGASFKWSTAIARAVCEVLQMYSGLDAVVNEHWKWEDVVSVQGVLGDPKLAWSDPLFSPHITHLTTPSQKTWSSHTTIDTVPALLKHLEDMGHDVIVTDLKSEFDVKVVRVFITNTTQPDGRLERISERLLKWQKHEGLSKGFYSDPILT